MALLNRGMAGAPQGLQAAYMRDPRLRMAQALQMQGADTSPVGHWAQGLARLAQALAGNRLEERAEGDYQKQADAYQNDMRGFMSPVMEQGTAGPGPRQGPGGATMRAPNLSELQARMGGLQSPYAMEAARPMLQSAMEREAAIAARGTWKPTTQNGLPGQVNTATNEFKPDPMPRASNTPRFAMQNVGGRLVAIDQSDPTKRMDIGPYGSPEAPKEQGPAPAFPGSGMQQQLASVLLDPNISPSDPRYHWAYAQATAPQERFDPALNQVVTIRPQIPPTIRQPVYPNQGAPQAQPVGQTPDAGMGPGGQAMPSAQPPQAPMPQANAPQQITPTMSVQQIGDPKPKDFTESQAKANMFGTLMEKGHGEIASLKVPSTAAILAWRNLPEGAVNMGLPENDQKYFNSLRTFAAGILRKETGASFGKGELEDVQSRFFPMPGDTPNVIAQKAASRSQAVASMKAELPGGQFRGVVAPPIGGGAVADAPLPPLPTGFRPD